MREPTMTKLRNDLSKLSDRNRSFLDAPQYMLIGGQWVGSSGGATFPVFDPTSSEQIARVPEAGPGDVDRAVRAARRALESGDWPAFKTAARERLILKLADLLEAHAKEFAELESVNSGRTLVNTRQLDVDLSVDYLRYMAGWTTKIHGKTVDVSVPYLAGKDFMAFTRREPIGVVAAITPWNVPLGQAVWKIAPALATGCTVVLKPAEQTPLTALKFGRLIAEAGIPDGVVNIITGHGESTGAALVAHPDVDKISFTGSTEVGQIIGENAAKGLKKVTLELGGKSPVIVFDDADLEIAIPGAAWAIFGNHGQNCCAGSRLYVHKRLYDRVVEGVAEIAAKIRLGPSLDPETEMGPLISTEQQQRVLSYIESGVSEGGRLLVGGHAAGLPGCYVEPTVVVNTNQKMRVVREEIFGPVLVAMPIEDESEALKLANDSPYGLAASVWTRDITRAHRFIRGLQAGTVWVNTHNVLDAALPFGGFKRSGIGRELGEEAIYHHTKLKAAVIALN